jgi:tetratricopeptide (TPR) repeat protein
MYECYCTICKSRWVDNLTYVPYCRYCAAPTVALRIKPLTPSDVVGVSLLAGSIWVMEKYHKYILKPLIIEPVREIIAQARKNRDIAEKLGKLESMVSALEAGDYKGVLAIGRTVDMPHYYTGEIRAKFMALLALAQFSEGDLAGALKGFKEFTRIETELNAPNRIIAMGHLLIAETSYRMLGDNSASNAPFIEQGLTSMSEAIKRLPPDAEYYVLRALLYCGKGLAGPARRDAELALELDPDNAQALKVLESITRLDR